MGNLNILAALAGALRRCRSLAGKGHAARPAPCTASRQHTHNCPGYPFAGPRFVFSHPAHFLAFGFGAGLSPYAPGTVGTLVAFPLFFLLRGLDPAIYFALVAVLYIAGVWFCDVAGKSLGVSDHGGIVWDEIVAFLLVLHFSPPTLPGYASSFLLFRLFDIWKPFPIRYADRHIHGGFGVMFDDLLAALYAVVCLLLLVRWGVI